MWSRIKNSFQALSIPITVKLTILYTVILTFILALISGMTIIGMSYVLHTEAVRDVDNSTLRVLDYLKQGNPVDKSLFSKNLLETGVILRVFDESSTQKYSNAPQYEAPPISHFRERDYFESPEGPRGLKDHFRRRMENPVPGRFSDKPPAYAEDGYSRQVLWHDRGTSYVLDFSRSLSEQTGFLHTLIGGLILANGLGLLFAIWSGSFLSRRILEPIRGMTQAAREIEVNNLDRRLPVNHTKDELETLARTFNTMLDRIQTGFDQQRQFISDASHELRTPVTVLTGYAEMLDRWGKEDPSALQEGVDAIRSEAANMHALIENLLFLARTDKGKQEVAFRRVELAPLIEEVYRDTLVIAPEHQVRLGRNDPVLLEADPVLIKQMLRVFVENSVKYTPAGGEIALESRQTEGFSEISIRDSGVGIPAAEQTKVFDRFYRVDKSRTKATGGTGLGLSIARWIAEQHHGIIAVQSMPNAGTTFTVQLPLRRA
ncbi:MAG: sensor histidine kinase [Solirubrobacterales bacterium]